MSVQTKGTCSAEPGTSYKVSDICKTGFLFKTTERVPLIEFGPYVQDAVGEHPEQGNAKQTYWCFYYIPIWLLFVSGSGGGIAKCKHLHSKYSTENRAGGEELSRQNLLNSNICFKDFKCGWLQRKVAEIAVSLFMKCTPCLQCTIVFWLFSDLQQTLKQYNKSWIQKMSTLSLSVKPITCTIVTVTTINKFY